jgi:hypothetical protein
VNTSLQSVSRTRQWRVFASAALALLLSSCASYTSATRKGMEAFEHRDYQAAETVYSPAAEAPGKDQLVYLFDRATVRNAAGKFEESAKDFQLADRLSEIKNYTALATEVATVITNDRILTYKGEEFEHVLVSTYLALNYAGLGEDENAAVAARQVNRKLERLRDEGKRKYHLNAFSQYLAGVLFERLGNWNFAYVDYKKAFALKPNFEPLRNDVIRGALQTDNSNDLEKYRRQLGVSKEEMKEASKEMRTKGSVVLLYQNGFAPEKVPNAQWHELPEYRLRFNKHRAARLYLDGEEVARSAVLFNVEEAALENMKEKYATYLVKRAMGVATRAVVAHQLDKNNPGLGTLVAIAMGAASQADLRSWTTLPKDFQVARAEVKPGTYQATVRLEDIYGNLSAPRSLGKVEVKRPGTVALLQYRSLND